MKRYFSLFVCMLILLSTCFSNVIVSSEEVWDFTGYTKIETAADFAKIADNLAGSYAITKDITEPVTISIPGPFTGKLIGSNAAMTAEEIRTIHVQIDSDITNPSSKTTGVGLFHVLAEGACLKNLTVTGSVSALNSINVGAFAGVISTANQTSTYVTIENCTNNATVRGKGTVGGIAGYAYNGQANNPIHLKKLTNNGTVSTNGSSAGGIAGILGYISAKSTESLRNTGDISAVSGTAGGLIGNSYASIKKSYNTGTVSGANQIGGLVGLASYRSELISCYNLGSVSATGGKDGIGYAGGIFGYSSGDYPVQNCYTIANISGNNRNPFGAKKSGIASTKISNSYYHSLSNEDDMLAGTTAKTLEEIRNLTSLLGADFVKNTAYAYPDLAETPNISGMEYYEVKIEKTGNGTVTNEGGYLALKGTQMEITAVPENGYMIEKILVNGVDVSGIEIERFRLVRDINADSTISVRFAFYEQGLPEVLPPVNGFFSGMDCFAVNGSPVTAPVGVVFGGVKNQYADYQRTEYGILLSRTLLSTEDFKPHNRKVIQLSGEKEPNLYGHFGIRFYGNSVLPGETFYVRPYAVFSNGSDSKAVYGDISKRIIGESEPANIAEKKTLKVLSIGNSFSRNAHAYLREIAKAGGVELTLMNLYKGGSTLENHNTWKTSGMKYIKDETTEEITLPEALALEDWDVITFQQGSHESVDYSTYQPYLAELSAYVKENAPNAEQILHQTWAYHPDCSRLKEDSEFMTKGMTSEEMFQALKTAYSQAASSFSPSAGIIPSGEAFHNVMMLDSSIMLHAGDGYHANQNGEYLAGAVWYEVLTGHKIADNPFKPEHMSDLEWKILKICAHQAAESYN